MWKQLALVAAMSALATSSLGCGARKTTPNRVSQQGESCASRNDCASRLTCVGNVCVFDEIPISQTAKECDIAQCSVATDCDEFPDRFLTNPILGGYNPAAECPQIITNCLMDGAGSQACMEQASACDPWSVTCAARQCEYVFNCTTNLNCGGGDICVASACVECAADTDCGGGQPYCSQNECIECKSQADCNGDEYCRADGQCRNRCLSDGDCGLNGASIYTCSVSSGQCEVTPCTENRQCAVLRNNPAAVCRTDGTCTVPCTSDANCDSAAGDGPSFEACVSGTCTYVGCATDLECSVLLRNSIGDGEAAICVDPPVP